MARRDTRPTVAGRRVSPAIAEYLADRALHELETASEPDDPEARARREW